MDSTTANAPDRFEALDLHCVRHDRTLFAGLSFSLAPGQILQIEGPNGSGKTSLLRMLCGLLQPAQGEVRWRGLDIQAQRAEFLADVAYVGHLQGIKEDLTPRENLRMVQSLGRARTSISLDQALAQVGLYGFEDLPSRTLSAGQRRRVALARLLVLDARVWVLDEPFTALDRAGKALIESLLEMHSRNDGIAVLTTHQPVGLTQCALLSLQLAA
ncbi:MAG: cytochrome c biogenesis heme-transporting ATPase CcmA [Gammaproteobacteria bacterium]|nr:cytochrome c biogenesis heme-transporting ATPase CcmA [Gammaproteobacteria bacterium]